MKHVTLIICGALFLLPGCGTASSDKKLPTTKVSGVATFDDDQPVANLKVVLVPVDGGNYSPHGNLDENGKFQLTTYEKNDGAPAGKYKVYFMQSMAGGEDSGPPPATGPVTQPKLGPPAMAEKVVAKEFLSAKDTPLTVEVKPSESTIELKGIKHPAPKAR